MLTLVVFYLVLGQATDVDILMFTNTVGPVALVGTLGLSATLSAMRDTNNLWVPLFWFRISTIVYFGIGSLVPLYGSLATREYINLFFPVTDQQILDTNLLVAASALITLLGANVALVLFKPPRRDSPQNIRSLFWVGISFAIIGFAVKLLLVIPYTIGQGGGEALPGVVLNLSSLVPVSIYLLTRYTLLAKRKMLPLVLFLLLMDMGVSILTYSKGAVIISAMMFMLGYLSQGVNRFRILISSASMFLLMALLVPISDYARNESGRRFGTVYGGTLSDRFDITQSYFGDENSIGPMDGEQKQGVFTRISYTNAAAFAMHLYNSGIKSHTLENLWVLPIPRFLWEEKPAITDIGMDFNELAGGSRSSGSAPGLFADAYWNFGWWGLPILMLPLGFIYALMSRYALWVLINGRWILFVVVMLCIRMGFRVDGFLITDIFGPLFIVLAGHFCLVQIDKLMIKAAKHRTASAPALNA
ncbi:MAG: hypothetical protein ACR652_08455 [Methylocystis sp.]|uniref:hypothetical protein n=1 Tax=Methylocystis sp. TaxID=1911079 RepID=UPI003DA56351